MSAYAHGQVIHCPHCGQEIPLDQATVNQVIKPLRAHWEQEMRQAEELAETKIAKLEKQLGRVSKNLTEAQRKTRTGSAIEEGYARQDLFADELQRRFLQDEIIPVHRGIAGADITQVVRQGGAECGTILWEVKRAASWVPGWTSKLAADRDMARALLGVIVSESLPANISSFGQIGGVWVCSFADAGDLAGVLRELVVTAWHYQVAAAGRTGAAEKVFDYVMTGNFSQRFALLTDLAAGLLQDVEQDKRALERRWKRTEVRIRQIMSIRDSIGGDLIEAVGADTELPAAFRVELSAVEAADEPSMPTDGPAPTLGPSIRPAIDL